MKIHIVPATPRFARAINQVFYKTWLATYPNEKYDITIKDVHDNFKNQKKRADKRKERLKSMDENEIFLLAKEGNKIVGVCSITKDQNINKLGAIYILPEYQGKGVGGLLLKKTELFFDPKLPTILSVAVYNTNAIQFYKKHGFVIEKIILPENYHPLKNGKKLPVIELEKPVK